MSLLLIKASRISQSTRKYFDRHTVSLKKRVSFAFTGSLRLWWENRTLGSLRYSFVAFALEKLSDREAEVKIYLQHKLHFWKNFFFYFLVLSQRSPSYFLVLSQRCPGTKITWHPKISHDRAKANRTPRMEQRNVSSLHRGASVAGTGQTLLSPC